MNSCTNIDLYILTYIHRDGRTETHMNVHTDIYTYVIIIADMKSNIQKSTEK